MYRAKMLGPRVIMDEEHVERKTRPRNIMFEIEDRPFAEIGRVAVAAAGLEEGIEKCLRRIECYFSEEKRLKGAIDAGYSHKCVLLKEFGVKLLDELGDQSQHHERKERFSGYMDLALDYGLQRNTVIHGAFREWYIDENMLIREEAHLVKRDKKTNDLQVTKFDADGLILLSRLHHDMRVLTANIRSYRYTFNTLLDRHFGSKTIID